ncbi:MAG: glycosyltransferase, partial [candidate division WOR-3 bacterium]|nr:glycosyltransferase [candidate division WOR-3 bacterium]
ELQDCYYDNNLISFWGMFHKGKNIELLLRGFQMAIGKNPKLRLLLIGSKHPRHVDFINELQGLIKNLGLDNSINLMFNQPSDIITQYLQKSCAVVLPFVDGVTFRRGTFIAAARLGVPVITSKGEDTPVELINNHNIIFANNYMEIADAILSLTADNKKRNEIGKNLKKITEMFNWDSIAEKHIIIYENILKDI